MEEQKTLKQIADDLMQKKGNVKGEVIRANFVYIKEKKGEDGLKSLEGKLNELGIPIKHGDIKPFNWYSEALSALIVIVAKEVFSWTEADIFDMGNQAPKYSFILMKILLKYFVSTVKVFELAPYYWKRHFDTGEIERVEFNEKEKYVIFRVKGHNFHPLVCIYEAGYYLRIAQFSTRSKDVHIEETKCAFADNPYHEYKITWV